MWLAAVAVVGCGKLCNGGYDGAVVMMREKQKEPSPRFDFSGTVGVMGRC